MIKLTLHPYLDNALSYWHQNIPMKPASYTEDDYDKDFLDWFCPRYRCRLKVRKKNGFARWFEFDNDQDAMWFVLRWSA